MNALCIHCKEAPCTWEALAAEVLIPTEDHFADINAEDAPNNEKRKYAFHLYVERKHGHLGRGVRVKNPECVLIGVRDRFPDPTGSYMGHRES